VNESSRSLKLQTSLKMSYQTQTKRRPPIGPKNAVFVPGDLDLQFVRAKDQTRLPCEFGANRPLRSAVTDTFPTQTKTWQTAPKTEP